MGYLERDQALATLGFVSYAAYLESGLWRSIRSRVLERDDRTCALCGKGAKQVHHLDYGLSTLQGRRLRHLVSICGPCHVAVEYDGDRKRSFEEALAFFRQLPKVGQVPRSARPRQKRKKKGSDKYKYIDKKQRESDLQRLRDIAARRKIHEAMVQARAVGKKGARAKRRLKKLVKEGKIPASTIPS